MFEQFDRILAYIDEYDGDDYVSIESGSPATEADVTRIADAFEIPLPASYREFLSTFGTLSIGGTEIAGSSAARYLDVVQVRDDILAYHAFPNDLIPIENEDGDSYVCVEANGQVVRWDVLHPQAAPFQLNESLGEYLLRLCEELIEDEGGDDD
jgi:hypothetical protein